MFPRLFHIGSFYLPTYGVLVASGVLIGLWISVRNSEKQGINGDDAWNLGIFVVLAGIIGAKVLYIINDWSSYANNWREIFSLNTLQAGGVFSGGLIGRARRGRLVHAASSHAAPAHHGRHLRPAWPSATCSDVSDAFPPDAVTASRPVTSGASTSPIRWRNAVSGTPLGVRIEPTQLIEAAAEFFNFLLLMWLLKRKKFDGQVFAVFMILYGVERYFIEFLRDDPGRGEVFGGADDGHTADLDSAW